MKLKTIQKSIPYCKYSGCGNTFVLVDNQNAHFFFDPDLTRSICTEKAVDGLIVLEHSSIASYRMRIFNADGSEAEMCGNGLRCLGAFIKKLGEESQDFTVETVHGIIPVRISESYIEIDLGEPTNKIEKCAVKFEEQQLSLYFLNTGVPHAVLFLETYDELKNLDLQKIGRFLRHHSAFAPSGANINAAFREESVIHYRTYERGVEAETQACGTGAMAVAIAANKEYSITNSLKLIPTSEEPLEVVLFPKLLLRGATELLEQEGF